MNSFASVREKRNGKEKMCVGTVLLLFRCSLKGENESEEPTVVLNMECVPPADEVDEGLRLVALPWATAGSAERGHDVEEEGGHRGAVPPGERYGAVPFQSAVDKVHVVRANTALHSFLIELP